MKLVNIWSKRDGYRFYGEDDQGIIYDLKMPVKIISVKQLANQLRDYFRIRENGEWKHRQAKQHGFFYSR